MQIRFLKTSRALFFCVPLLCALMPQAALAAADAAGAPAAGPVAAPAAAATPPAAAPAPAAAAAVTPAPAPAGVASAPAAHAWSAPADWLVYGVPLVVLFGALVSILIIKNAVGGTHWNLADALSEDTDLTVLETKDPPRPLLDKDGKPMTATVMQASTSRLIALMGLMVILLMFLGFGVLTLFSFGRTGNMPDSTDKIVQFLASGMTLFAPYLVNKFSGLFAGFAPKK